MLHALRSARKGMIHQHGGPFGACIVKNGKIIATAHNSVLKNKNALCHAEINAIAAASKKLKKPFFIGTTLYSTTEPCPMCFSAIHWARIDRIVYGTDIADVKKRGFNELSVSNATLKKLGHSSVKIVKHFFRKECLQLLKDWDQLKKKQTY